AIEVGGRAEQSKSGLPGAWLAGGGDRVALVIESPGRVSHQAHRPVSRSPRLGLSALDRRHQVGSAAAGKLGVGAAHGVQDVRVGRADLRRAKPQVQAAREPVEYIETWCCVLDLDRIEVELGREPSNAMNRTASHLSLRAPEGMSGHGQTTLLVD